MRQGDRYPEALEISHQRFSEALVLLGSEAPFEFSDAYEELKKKIHPPLPSKQVQRKMAEIVF